MTYSETITSPPAPIVPKGKKSKRVKLSGHKSVARAAAFMQEISAFGGPETISLPAGTSVTAHTLPLPTYSSCSTLSATGVSHLKTSGRAPVWPLWWRTFIRSNPTLFPLICKPLTWNEAPLILKLEFYYWALRRFGRVYTFSLNLHPDLEAKAKAQPKPCDWLNRRISRWLEQVLGRKVMLVIVCEEELVETRPHVVIAEDRRLHLHGMFIITDNELIPARKALRMAGVEQPKTRQYQAHTHPNEPDAGWSSYIGKELWRTSPVLRKWLGRGYLTDYPDTPLYASAEVARVGRKLFGACRWQLLKARTTGRH